MEQFVSVCICTVLNCVVCYICVITFLCVAVFKRYFEALGHAIKRNLGRGELKQGIEVPVSLPFHESAFSFLKLDGFFTRETYAGCERYTLKQLNNLDHLLG